MKSIVLGLSEGFGDKAVLSGILGSHLGFTATLLYGLGTTVFARKGGELVDP